MLLIKAFLHQRAGVGGGMLECGSAREEPEMELLLWYEVLHVNPRPCHLPSDLGKLLDLSQRQFVSYD